MDARVGVLALAACLLVAGCSAMPLAEEESPTQTPTEAVLLEETVSPDSSQFPLDDPWPGSPTVVAINDSATNRSVAPLVDSALSFWAENDDRYANYTTTFELRPNATDPDVVVRFVDDVGACGYDDSTTFVGCAPVLSDRIRADRPTVVTIETGLTNESTERVIEHEFGHVLGLEHGDEPIDLMSAATDDIYRLPQPNASERALTFLTETVTVYADRSALPGTDEQIDRQLSAALDYYNDGAEGFVPENLSLVFVEDPDAADITITARQMETASNETLIGNSSDADPALEYYTSQTILVSTDLDPETLGWHVGLWLGDSLVAPETPSGLPPAFDDPRTDPRREWWE